MSNYISLISGTLVDAKFGGTDLSDKKFYCYDFVKGLMPRQEEVTIDVPDTPGIIQLSKKFISRPIKIYGYLDCSSHADLISKINDLAGFLYSATDQQLILSNENDRYYNAQYIDYAEIWRKKDYAKIVLVFNCNDPFAYAITFTSGNKNCATKPTTIPVNNEGNYKACPIWIITFNQVQTHITLYNDDGTERIDISRNFGVGHKLKIDTKDEIIYYDSGPGYVEDWQGVGSGGEGGADFVKLKVGEKDYYITTVDDNLNVNVAWEFHKTWL